MKQLAVHLRNRTVNETVPSHLLFVSSLPKHRILRLQKEHMFSLWTPLRWAQWLVMCQESTCLSASRFRPASQNCCSLTLRWSKGLSILPFNFQVHVCSISSDLFFGFLAVWDFFRKVQSLIGKHVILFIFQNETECFQCSSILHSLSKLC